MHKANDASCPRSFETNVCMYDSEFRPSRVVSFRTVATQKTSPTNRTLFRATRPIVTPSGVDAPRDVNWTTSPSIAKATRSFTRATETIARPSREFKRFKSRRMRTLTGSAVTAIAVPRNRDCANVIPSAAARLYPREKGRKNSTKATTMLRSLNAFRRPSRPSSIPARSTRMKTPRLATTFNDSPNEVVGSGLMRPRTIGPTRIPASTSPIIGDWWSFSIASPAPAMTKGWYKSTPPGFLFAMKMPKRITHEKKLKGVAENLGWFYASAKELREKCGPLVAQLPPSIKFDSHWVVMQEFLRALEVDKYPHAIEFRHKSWFRDDVYKLLRDRNVTMVWSENQYLRTPTDVTSDQVYLRMVGDREITEFKEVQKDKSAEMRTWYKELEESSDSVKGALVFFNNHYAGFGPGSVNEFRRLAGMMEYQFPTAKAGAGSQRGLADFG